MIHRLPGQGPCPAQPFRIGLNARLSQQPSIPLVKWIETVLRRQLGFDGAVVSDDLEMAGALVMGDVLARAEQALAAGCDLLPVCNDPAAVVRLLDQLRKQPPPGTGNPPRF